VISLFSRNWKPKDLLHQRENVVAVVADKTLITKERPKIKLRPKIVTFTSFYNCKALNTSYMRSFNICLTTPSIIKEQPPVSFSVITFEAILQFFVREKELI